MKFNFNDYVGKYAMRCKTEIEKENFRVIMHENNKSWANGESYIQLVYGGTYYLPYCYGFNEGSGGSEDYYRKKGYTILEWSDFMNKTEKANGETINVNLANLSKDEQKQLMALVEKANKPANLYDFEIGMTHWRLISNGNISKEKWDDYECEHSIFKQGNAFLTEQEAINEREKRFIHQKLKMFAKMNNEGEIDWEKTSNRKYFIALHSPSHKVYVDFLCDFSHQDIYFTSKEIAEKAIQHIGEERLKKYYFGVE